MTACQQRIHLHNACHLFRPDRLAWRLGLASVLALVATHGLRAADPDWSTLPYTPFSTMQAVEAAGYPSWTMPMPPPDYVAAYRLRGVVLNAPAEMLNTAAGAPGFMGGQWQIFLQAVALSGDATNCPELVDDFGGAALWMGQYQGKVSGDPDDSYTDEEWLAELDRINHPIDLATGLPVTEPLRPGDLIEVHARGGKAYGGKFNCNEEHQKTTLKNFDLYVLDRDRTCGSAPITLDSVMDSSGNFKFDANRVTGAEFYQAQRVTLEGVTINSAASTWTPDGRSLSVTDGAGRSLSLWLGHNPAFGTAELPTGTLNVSGIFNQESGSGDPTKSYSIFVTDPGDFVPDVCPAPGDANRDGVVNSQDAAILASHWLQRSSASWFDGDFNGDRAVNDLDASILAAHWAYGSTSTSVPEPTAGALVLAGLVMFFLRRARL